MIGLTESAPYGSAGGVRDGTRSYSSPTGTPCVDTDDDGLPDEYEEANSADSVSLNVDSMSYGFSAFDWFSNGRNLDATLVGCEDLSCAAEEGSSTATFGTVDRYVYIVPMQTQAGVNFPNFSPTSEIAIIVNNPAGDSAIVVSCTEQGTPEDSATVHARLTAWNRPTTPTAVALRDYLPASWVGC